MKKHEVPTLTDENFANLDYINSVHYEILDHFCRWQMCYEKLEYTVKPR